MKVLDSFRSMSDKELMEWYHFAQEYRDRKYLIKIKEEIKRRWCYA